MWESRLKTQLEPGLAELGLTASPRQLECLGIYLKEIEFWNPTYKLVAKTDDLIIRHVLDSLAGLKTIQTFSPRRIADVGSGAGFPGIPIALWLDHVQVALIERSKRRAGFLRNAVRLLKLDNVEVLEKPVEDAAGDGPFDVITFRAWAAFDTVLLDRLIPILAEGGVIAAYKGRMEALETELAEIASLCRVQLIPLHVPGMDVERSLGIVWP